MKIKYLVDANIFIGAYRQYYPMDIFPSFWEQLVAKGGMNIILLDEVYAEILKGDDDLVGWFKENKTNFKNLDSMDEDIISSYRLIGDRIQSSKRYNDNAIHEYLGVADSWICAAAKAKGYIIVTNEKSSNTKKKVKIPDVCDKNNIEYCDIISFMRGLNMKF